MPYPMTYPLTCCSGEAAFSCFVSTVGLVLPFVLTDPALGWASTGLPISNAESATAVWINTQGFRRVLTFSNADSAVFTYVLSQQDTRSPHIETGYLEVTIGGAVFPTSTFVFRVNPHF